MGHSHAVPVPEKKKQKTSKPPSPQPCVVNDTYLGGSGLCGRPSAQDRECFLPVCAAHLCQYKHSNGHRCRSTSLRLVQGNVMYTSADWFPDVSLSVNCARHEGYNCTALINGVVRCAERTVPGQAYCETHMPVVCKWKVGSGRRCGAETCAGSNYCKDHCCSFQTQQGVRCRQRRCQSSWFCTVHRCVWKQDERSQCHLSSDKNSTLGVCSHHVCAREGCERRAHDGVNRCVEHVCAFQPPNWRSIAPACDRDRVEGEVFCEYHRWYVGYLMRGDQGT